MLIPASPQLELSQVPFTHRTTSHELTTVGQHQSRACSFPLFSRARPEPREGGRLQIDCCQARQQFFHHQLLTALCPRPILPACRFVCFSRLPIVRPPSVRPIQGLERAHACVRCTCLLLDIREQWASNLPKQNSTSPPKPSENAILIDVGVIVLIIGVVVTYMWNAEATAENAIKIQ